MPDYDYIIIGAGASGLLLTDALGKDSFFREKSILILEKGTKTTNDRTWCFWDSEFGQFDHILHTRWSKISFVGQQLELHQSIEPYHYKMLQGIDFYHHYLQKITSYPNVTLKEEAVLDVDEEPDGILVKTALQAYKSEKVFDSRFRYTQLRQQTKYPVLQQHFLGWFVKTENPVFTTAEATFMDFSIPQRGNTRFMYVLPFSENEALVEYTLFSEHTLEKSVYENAIKDYLNHLDTGLYEIIETEHGNIPMSCFEFSRENTDRYLKIGIAGGWAKASTGFTFMRSVKKVDALIAHLKQGKPLSRFMKKNRYWLYDLLFLDVLHRNNHLGGHVFESLFKKRSPQLVLKFLDEETTLWEDVLVMWACPKWIFSKALLRRIFK